MGEVRRLLSDESFFPNFKRYIIRMKESQIARDVFYREEQQWFKDAFDMELSKEGATIIFKKLCKHYKLDLELKFYKLRKYAGTYCRGLIKIQHDPTLGVLIHEICHDFEFKHNYKLKTSMLEVYKYCKLCNFWKEEISRRSIPKLKKAKPSIDKKRDLKIKRLEERLENIDRRLKLYTTKRKKVKRSLKMMIVYKKKRDNILQE